MDKALLAKCIEKCLTRLAAMCTQRVVLMCMRVHAHVYYCVCTCRVCKCVCACAEEREREHADNVVSVCTQLPSNDVTNAPDLEKQRLNLN